MQSLTLSVNLKMSIDERLFRGS